MARFLGTAAGRAEGGGSGGGLFTKAKVFTNAGSTTYDVPSGTKHVKAYVVGAGTNYRAGLYCFHSENCASGVNFPTRYYCACFCGHLTGAGGGYSEKLWTAKDDQIAGKQLTITVGSQGGQSASSVDGTGLTAVSAANATDTTYTRACTNNDQARDNSQDNPIEGGFQLPVCGYANNFNGYVNDGGTASGGDINRTGGQGKMIPEWIYDGYLDAYSTDLSGGGGGGGGGSVNKSSCWVNPVMCCSCWRAYHYVYGSNCCNPAWTGTSCTCYYLCTYISNLCAYTGGGGSGFSGTPRKEVAFLYRGNQNILDNVTSRTDGRGSCGSYSVGSAGAPKNAPGGSSYGWTGTPIDDVHTAHQVPKGIGASSGYSAGDGSDGRSEGLLADVTPYNSQDMSNDIGSSGGGGAGAGTEMTIECGASRGGYDYQFGGYNVWCACFRYFPGYLSSASSLSAECTSGQNVQYCYHCAGFVWSYVFGACQSGGALCFTMPYGNVTIETGPPPQNQDGACMYKTCYNMAYLQNPEAGKVDTYTIPLSTLLNADTDGNQEDIEYGRGATLTQSAAPGGGGNREHPTAPAGMVVLVYG